VYQRGSLLDGLAMHLSCDTKKFHDNESTHILHNFWTSTHRGEASPLPPGGATDVDLLRTTDWLQTERISSRSSEHEYSSETVHTIIISLVLQSL